MAAVRTGALVAALLVCAPLASAQAATGVSASGGGWFPRITPLRHAIPSGQTPFLGSPSTPSRWTPLVHQPGFSPGTMLLESDGTVLVHYEPESGGTPYWYRLTPDRSGSYVNGTWAKLPPMPNGYNPLYFASAILPDGRMIVEGGEYLGGNPVWTKRGALYDPVTNSWRTMPAPTGWTNIGDSQSEVLPDGTFMLSQACTRCTSPDGALSTAQALLNPSTLTWTRTGTNKADPNDEEGWNLEPSDQVLTVDTWTPRNTELYTPSSRAWESAGDTATQVVNDPNKEIGPQVVMPGGDTFVVGAGTAPPPAPGSNACDVSTNAHTSVYHFQSGRWTAGPTIPTFGGNQFDSADGPASILPNGNVLFDVSKCVFETPTRFFLYSPATNTLTQEADPPNAANDSTFFTRMLVLPTGQVLFNDGSHQMEIYTAGGTAPAAWQPVIAQSPSSVARGGTYNLTGQQLAGLSQGAAYGDDVQDNTNFPLVRITNNATGGVTYARTSNWSSVSINPGTWGSTKFTVPTNAGLGPSTLAVVANGIASTPREVTVTAS
jgi:hypothetical protein